jgi:hypothetical protein
VCFVLSLFSVVPTDVNGIVSIKRKTRIAPESNFRSVSDSFREIPSSIRVSRCKTFFDELLLSDFRGTKTRLG